MQQRRGTAAQWISTNSGAGPVLNADEMGWESLEFLEWKTVDGLFCACFWHQLLSD